MQISQSSIASMCRK